MSNADSGVNRKQQEHSILDGNRRIKRSGKKREGKDEKHKLQNKLVKENCLLVES